ncbi:MAG: phage holin [Ruminococcaceae bacterium]|jgi:phi LC3 family holin|nr:phage holin [Oscillospiraceae bacterium]
MKINWTVRIKNKAFWVTAIPALLLLVAQVLQLFGVTVDFAGLSNQLLAIVGTVFGLLTLLGVVNDPTTAGVSDSTQALQYSNPKSGGQA